MCSFFSIRLRSSLLSAVATMFAGSLSAQGLTFDAALLAAAQRAPMLQARAASVQGSMALQASAAELPDPKLSVGIDSLPINGPDRGSLTRDNFTQRQIGWTQDVPNKAKRAARTDAALARTERDQALLQIEQLAVRREAGLAWLAAYFSDKRLQLFEQLMAQQGLLQDTATAQLAAGKIAPADITATKLEVLALGDRRDELQRDKHHAHAMLRRWTGSTPPAGLSGEAPRLTIDRAYLEANLERSPEVAAIEPARALAGADLREAEAAKSGDWSWSLRYGKRGPAYSDFVSAQLTFDLPLSVDKRQQPQIDAKQKELIRLDAERDDVLQRQRQELETQLSELDELSSKLNRLTQQTVGLAAQKTALVLAAYESGRDKLSSVLEARKQQTETGLRALELQARQAALQWRLNTILPAQTPLNKP